MSLTKVKMSEEVWLTCLTHALSTETEEIMGLLLGDIQHSRDGSVIALIWGALPQPRSDRKKDRVETNPEQLTAASAEAEISFHAMHLIPLHKMTLTLGRTTRVIGWYHSHPHITVLPSHVDVRTQAMYQLLDSGFIGLIFSCFSEDAQKAGRIQVIAFQSLDGKQQHSLRPVSVAHVNRSSVIDIDSSLSSSGKTSTRGDEEIDTADSRVRSVALKSGRRSSDLGGFLANADARMGQNNRSNDFNDPSADSDSMDLSESMQEAMHRSTLEMSGAEYVRKEVPLFVLPASSLLNLASPLASFGKLQRVIYEEERTAFNEAILQSVRDGKVHPLTYIHHTSTYQASICKLMEYCLSPAIVALQDHLTENETRENMASSDQNKYSKLEKTLPPDDDDYGKKDKWEEIKCFICLEQPHNAVLLICTRHQKGCHPYICNTSDRLSNCLNQFQNLFSQESSPSSSSDISQLLDDHNDGGDDHHHNRPGVDLARCSLCGGDILGCVAVEADKRKLMDSTRRVCSAEWCPFVGDYDELRNDVED
ncbi:OLC1v1014643C2 [Oldenlandia corymbosa var. corymbosa]|uniref:OLC1v1014643C2 n=1 Tax=Oldenlandia corymbosa var. corymbosa TaxID=529605 RepID=A0AAV1E1R7_OLDCO|nr:OLC1v1014643C2 [Oldenlandia corymbosa var. corymbosa]